MDKKIFIEIPTWLGDSVMATPAVQNIIKTFPDCKITLLGSYASTSVFKGYKNVTNFIINDSKNSPNRYLNLIKLAKKIGKVDIAISFRRSFSSKFMMYFVSSNAKFQYKREKNTKKHLVDRYNDFINKSLNINLKAGDLKLYFEPFLYQNKTLGINPGATYGSAKRWYPEEFADVCAYFAKDYDIVIFGGANEVDIANDIEQKLIQKNIKNYQNLAGKTTIEQLTQKIAGLSLFITNDSGPMHIAAAYKVKTVAIFGSTNFNETNQWQNPNEIIVTKNLPCAPCMKRECPLKHHECMNSIKAKDVIEAIEGKN